MQHFEIEDRALLQPLRFEQAARSVQFVEPLAQLRLDAVDRLQKGRARRDIMRIGVEFDLFEVLEFLAGERVEFGKRLHLVAEEGDAPGAVFVVGGKDFHRIAAHAKGAAGKIRRALVLQSDEILQQLALVELFAELHRKGHGGIGLDRAYAVNAGDRGDDDHVVAFEQGAGGGMAHPVDLLVDRGFLLDKSVGARHIGFGLVIVVIGDEIFDRVIREKALELAVKLGGERLVGRQDQRRALRPRNDLRHGESLARAGDAEQHLIALLRLQTFDQFVDGVGLVALGGIFRDQLEADAAFRFFRPRRAMRNPGRGVAQIGIAFFQQFFEKCRGNPAPGLEFRFRRRPPHRFFARNFGLLSEPIARGFLGGEFLRHIRRRRLLEPLAD